MRWALNERRWLVLVAVAALAVLFWWWQRGSQPALGAQSPIEAGGVRVSLLRHPVAVGAGNVAAGANDFLMESRSVRLTIGGRADSAESRLRRGSLLDLALRDFRADRLEQLRPALSVNAEWVPLDTVAIRPEVADSRVTLIITQRARSFEVTTRVWLDAVEPKVHLESSVENRSKRARETLGLGDRIEWPGTLTYAPRHGFMTEPGTVEAAWIAKEGTALSYALVFDEGPAQTEFNFDRVGPVGALALGKSRALAPGERLTYRRTLLVSDGRLGEVSLAVFRHKKRKIGRVIGSVRPVPKRAIVVASLPDGRPLTQTETGRDGTFELSLPVGSYVISATTPGGTDQEHVEILQGRTKSIELLAPLASSLRFTIQDDSGRLLPGRITLRGVHPTKNPDFGARQRADGVRNLVYSASGEGELELPEGKYRVFVTHGIEYSIFEKVIEVGQDTGATVRAALKQQVDTTGWVSGDFHLHSAPSFDSSIPLEDRVTSLAAEGVEFAVATDHNHVTDFGPALRGAGVSERLGATPGVEITTKRWGHFIAFPYPEDQQPPPFEGVDPGVMFNAVRESAPNALIQVNHPRLENIAYFAQLMVNPAVSAVGEREPDEQVVGATSAQSKNDAVGNDDMPDKPKFGPELLQPPPGFSFDFDTVEVINGFELEKAEAIEQNIADWFALLNVGFRYTAVGNSDSHSLVHQWAGFPRTYVRVSTEDPTALSGAEVADALLYGRAQISNGIFLDVSANGSAAPGDQLTLNDGRLDLRVLARAAPWVDVSRAEVWVNGVLKEQTTATAPITASNRIQWATSFEFSSDVWLVVIARGSADLGEHYPGAKGKPFAMTNPLYLDVDGDGVFHAPLSAPVQKPRPPPHVLGGGGAPLVTGDP